MGAAFDAARRGLELALGFQGKNVPGLWTFTVYLSFPPSRLSGSAGGAYQVGPGEPTATIRMDALDFNILASGRFTSAEGHTKASVSGDLALAERTLKKTLVLY